MHPPSRHAGIPAGDPIEIEQEQKYESRLAQEARMRAAIVAGQKQFQEEK